MTLTILVAAAVIACGCGAPFNVKTRAAMPAAHYTRHAGVGAVGVGAEALRDEDLLYDVFDANLILAGVLAVRVEVTNSGAEPLDLKGARFEVRSPDGSVFKNVDSRAAFKRLIAYYQISAYSKAGYKRSREDLASHELDLKAPLAPNQSREGLVFFRVPDSQARQSDLTLSIMEIGGKQSKIELKLN